MLVLLLLNVFVLLLIELRVKLNRFDLEPVDPLAQIGNAVVIHQSAVCLVPLHLQEFELFANFEHLLLVSLPKVALMRN